jgi:hypothetical protein
MSSNPYHGHSAKPSDRRGNCRGRDITSRLPGGLTELARLLGAQAAREFLCRERIDSACVSPHPYPDGTFIATGTATG